MGCALVAVVGASDELLNLKLMTSNLLCYSNVHKLRKEEREQPSTSKDASADLHSRSQRPESLHLETQAQQSTNGLSSRDENSRVTSRSASLVRHNKKLSAAEKYLRRWKAAVRSYSCSFGTILITYRRSSRGNTTRHLFCLRKKDTRISWLCPVRHLLTSKIERERV